MSAAAEFICRRFFVTQWVILIRSQQMRLFPQLSKYVPVEKSSEALVAVDNAINLDPRKQNFCVCHLWFRGVAYTLLERWQPSIDDLKRHLTRFPRNFWARAYLAVDYVELSKYEAARAEVEEVQKLDPNFSVDMMFPTASMDHKAFPAKIDRFRAELHRAGLE